MRNQKEKILFFTNELALLIKSGLTFTKAIEIILKEEKNKKFKDILKKIHKNLTMGKNIYDSFKPFENTFGSTYLYILKIGELSGNIVESLEDISKSLDFDLSRRKKLGGILIYPIVVICLTFLTVSFLLIFILPSFITIFEENQIELPLITRILLGISRNFHYILILLRTNLEQYLYKFHSKLLLQHELHLCNLFFLFFLLNLQPIKRKVIGRQSVDCI